MKDCPYCFGSLSDIALRCKHCGKWLVESIDASSHEEIETLEPSLEPVNESDTEESDYALETWQCPNCGNRNPVNALFCTCGFRVGKETYDSFEAASSFSDIYDDSERARFWATVALVSFALLLPLNLYFTFHYSWLGAFANRMAAGSMSSAMFIVLGIFRVVLGIALVSVISALFLMVGVRVAARFWPNYGVAYKAALFSSMASFSTGTVFIILVGLVIRAINAPLSSIELSIASYVPSVVVGFFTSSAFLGAYIVDPSIGQIGFGRGCIVNLLQIAIAIVIGVVFIGIPILIISGLT